MPFPLQQAQVRGSARGSHSGLASPNQPASSAVARQAALPSRRARARAISRALGYRGRSSGRQPSPRRVCSLASASEPRPCRGSRFGPPGAGARALQIRLHAECFHRPSFSRTMLVCQAETHLTGRLFGAFGSKWTSAGELCGMFMMSIELVL